MVLINHPQRHRHALPEITIRFRYDHTEPIDQVGPEFSSLDILRGEFRNWRNKTDLADVRAIRVGVVGYQRLHPGIDPAQIAFADVGANPDRLILANGINNRTSGDDRTWLHRAGNDDAIDGRDQLAIG